ncbi:hypothetical protein CVIRNUC_010060 [Coccomyxa viridis]|uniref:Uncharacterized protein n=1 Tax=Coccomyxa viridis TaxID=1274662 RepID=A0AAV1IJL8_9CHLO|nr:hypothetical protein CVIRNUC_010060 [Coccomyxa viridis]
MIGASAEPLEGLSAEVAIVPVQAPSKRQVAWLRSTRTPIQRITFLPSCTPCRSTASAYIMRPQDTIRLCPGRISEHPPYLHSRRIGAAA